MPGHSVGDADPPKTENSCGGGGICVSDGPWRPSREKNRGVNPQRSIQEQAKLPSSQPPFAGRHGKCNTYSFFTGCILCNSLQ